MMLGGSCSPCCDPCNGFSARVPFTITGRLTDWFVIPEEPCQSTILSRPFFQSLQDYSVSMTCNGSLEANPSGGVPYANADWKGVPTDESGSVTSGDHVNLRAYCRVYNGAQYFTFEFGNSVIGGESFFSNVVGIPELIGFPYGSIDPTEFGPAGSLSAEVLETMATGGWFGLSFAWYDLGVSQSCWGYAGGVLYFYWPGLQAVPQIGACRRPSAVSPSGYQCQVTTQCECSRLATVFPSLGYQFLGVGTDCNPLP